MENLSLLPSEQLPETDEPKKKKETMNCLGANLREILDELGLKDADVVRGTGIAWSSYHGWITEDVDCQLTDDNLYKLWSFLNRFKKVPLEYLIYGIGDTEELKGNESA